MYSSMKNNNTEIRNLIKSFRYAFRGLIHTIKNERNMRIHIVVMLLVAFFSCLYALEPNQYAVLFLCFGFVITAEMVNTAIEALVNLESPAYDNLARIAKDVAAGAVFVSAIITVIVACFLFHDVRRLLKTFVLLVTTPVLLFPFLAAVGLGIFFIFFFPNKLRRKNSDGFRK